MTKISKEEYELLKSLSDRWEWMARDENGQLYKFMDKPRKINDSNWNDPAEMWLRMNDDNFKFIQWSDSEPYSIAELIEEYESEETEVDKQKLIEKWESAIEAAEFYGKGKEDRLIEYMRDFVDDLNQLDEPEVLSQEWISEHSNGLSHSRYVWVSDLKGVLVPKQEELDRAYKDGYEKVKQHTFYKGYLKGLYKGYLKGLADKESINPERSLEVDQHKELLDELNDLYARKNQDYGNSFDESLDEDGLLVLKIRLGDKYKRFSQLISNEQMVNDESMRDTLIDLANYALMGVMWMDKNGEEEDEYNDHH